MSDQKRDQSGAPASPTVCIIVKTRTSDAEANQSLVRSAHQLGITALQNADTSQLYYLQGNLPDAAVATLAEALLADPVTDTWRVRPLQGGGHPAGQHVIEVSFLPGVTDSAAANLVRTAHHLGYNDLERAATGRRYELAGDLSADDLARLASGLLANPVIQRFAIDTPLAAPFFAYRTADDTVETIPLRAADDAALLAISRERRLALDLAEMQAIQTYYRAEDREPTDVELETLAQTWSEHCVHKTFRAVIEYDGPPPGPNAHATPVAQTIDGLLKTYSARRDRGTWTSPGSIRPLSTTPASSPSTTRSTWPSRSKPTTTPRPWSRLAGPTPAWAAWCAMCWASAPAHRQHRCALLRPAGPAL